ncbi:uncharacterized protein KQ657_000516 [Scheffersomyces spartinae]|uniref:Uncharacterized protein n=1 Tax=Scheffersomyces spartinae TaxID=45513 RepID=A0A9P7V9G2_9ASCO|nr:uncharacterized protein KQ657_000516 [Scheffersomyces spartinae]KAG7193822.1 hypothetical protein KQ657_000516 [Scheffersomyces spartinae]
MLKRTWIPLARRFHVGRIIQNNYAYISDFPTLSSKIDSTINTTEKVPTDAVVEAVRACGNLIASVHEYDKFWENPINVSIQNKVLELLSKDTVEFDKELLVRLMLLKLPTKLNILIVSEFYKRNPTAFIDRSIALIPFRQSLYNGDLQNALKLTDMTVGHPNYVDHRAKEFRSGVIRLVCSAAGISLMSKFGVEYLIEFDILPEAWRHLSGISLMLVTYLVNSSFFVSMVKFGRQVVLSGGDYLTWQRGTFYTHWYTHGDEMLFCSKIVDADININGGGISGNEPTPGLIEELCRVDPFFQGHTLKPGYTRDGKKIRLLEARDNMEEIKMQAYWMTGGDGFEWVEPDQDPATLIWKNHLNKFDKPYLKDDHDTVKSLKWADDLVKDN